MIAKLVIGSTLAEKLLQVINRGLGDIAERLFGEKRLVGSDDNIGHRNKPGKSIIVHNMARIILEENIGFFFVNIKAGSTYFA